MRLFSGLKRDRGSGDPPPPWLLPLGAGGLAVGIFGRAVGGPLGAIFADLGCAVTGVGAVIFVGLLVGWRDLGKRKGDE
ncbi:MAG TPA: hypothetical protein VIL85_28505 [Thermomicrobiales bacterium]